MAAVQENASNTPVASVVAQSPTAGKGAPKEWRRQWVFPQELIGDCPEWHCRLQPLYGPMLTFFRVPLVSPHATVASAGSDDDGV
jgi:hypothetical protein